MEKKKAGKTAKPAKAAKKAIKPAVSKKSPKSPPSPKKAASGVRKTAAQTRLTQEKGSIAPPSQNLVSAFDLFKKKKFIRSTGPTVTRLAAGASLPKPPVLEQGQGTQAPIKPPEPTPRPAPSEVAPAPAPLAAAAPHPPAKASVAPPAAKPAASRPTQSPLVRTGPPARRPAFRSGARPGPKPVKPASKPAPKPVILPVAPLEILAPKPSLKKLQVSIMMNVRDLAEKMEVKPSDVIKKLMSLGIFATINQRLEIESASIVAAEFGFELDFVALYKAEEMEAAAGPEAEKPESLKPRAPVVTVMGHVDHGKTKLLDAIRSSRVAEGESGGITQHIGAYRAHTPKGDIVFLDTPGHEAFTAMRARGAKVTDIVILVVSATDGVMPQTIEAIDHARAADVPIVVAVNKIDLPGANPQKIRQDLAQRGIQPEEWGGKNIFVDVSAKMKLHIDTLLEMLALQAEILDLKANPDRPAYGVVLEARLDPKRGVVATVLVQGGTLKTGDSFVAGLAHGKIKALYDDTGKRILQAGPSTPVEVLGIINTPQAGDGFNVVADDRQAREIAQRRAIIVREQTLAHQRHMTLVGLKSQLAASVGATAVKDLNIVLKADVQGSLQAIKDSLEGLSNSECRVRIIRGDVGNANESDILLASASDAVTLLFHSDIEPRASELSAREGVEVRKYEIIYDLIADIKAALEGLLEPEIVEVAVGKGELREIFKVKAGKVAGCMIRDGKAARGGLVRIRRGGDIVYEGRLSTLKRFKDDVKEVEKGLECGMDFEGFKDFEKGDELEFYAKETRTRRLESAR